MDEPTESAFAGYRFHRVLGGTSSGGSFEATEIASGEAVVIESLIGADGDDPYVREWFTEAWEALAPLEHQNLPDVRSTGRQGDVPFAVRSPIEGDPLPRFLASDHVLDPKSMRILIARIADGLEQAHEAGVIHGALGPEHLVVRAEPGKEVLGVWIGFGRVEGLRSGDVLALGPVLEGMLEAETAAHDAGGNRAAATEEEIDPGKDGEPVELDADDEGRSPMDAAILSMLNDVAAAIRNGSYRSAAEVRDAVTAGSEPMSGPDSSRMALALIAALVVVVVVILLVIVV